MCNKDLDLTAYDLARFDIGEEGEIFLSCEGCKTDLGTVTYLSTAVLAWDRHIKEVKDAISANNES